MTGGVADWYLPTASLVFVALAFWTGDPQRSAESATVAATFAAAFLLLTLRPGLHWPGSSQAPVEADSLVLLRNAFSQGRFGRETILARLDALGGAREGGSAAHRLEERPRLLRVSDEEFLDHVDRRLREIEAHT